MSEPREPRPVPMTPDLILGNFYCLDCPCDSFFTRAQAMTHWRTNHRVLGDEYEPEEGIDYVIGRQLITMQERRLKWIEASVGEFRESLTVLVGGDDFVNEAIIHDA